MKSLDFLFFFIPGTLLSFPDVVAPEKNRSELLALITNRPVCLFCSNCSRSFSLSIALYFYWKTQERERAINILLSVLVVGRLSLSLPLCCINNLLWHDRWTINSLSMRKSDFSSSSHFLLPVCLSIYLLTTKPFYYYSFKTSFSSWQYHLSSKRMCIKEREREREQERGNL
jgi:hypothetical protein